MTDILSGPPSPTSDTTHAVITAIRAWNDSDVDGATLVLADHDQPTVIAELLSCCILLGRLASGGDQDRDAFNRQLQQVYEASWNTGQ